MTRLEVVVVVMLVALLGLQATALLGRKNCERYHVWSGILALLAATFSALGLWLFAGDRLVIVGPLGVMMVDGEAHYALRGLLLLLPLGGAVLIESARAARGRKQRALLVLGCGLLVGLFAAARVRPLSPEGVHVPLYGYDLWSPLPLCWIALCIVEWILVVLEFTSRPLALWLGALVVAGVTLIAWSHPRDLYFAPETAWLWGFLLVAGWAAAFSFGLRWGALTLFRDAFDERHRWRRRLLWAGCVGAGLALLPPLLRITCPKSFRGGWAAAVTGGVVLTFVIVRIMRLDRVRARLTSAIAGIASGSSDPATPTAAPGPSAGAAAPGLAPGQLRRIFDLILVPTLLLVLGFSADLLYFAWWPKSVDLAGLAITTLVLIELTSEGPLRDAGPTLAMAVWGTNSFARAAVGRVGALLHAAAKRFLAPLERLVGGSWVSKTVGKLALVIVVLVIVQEIPNHGRTLIYPLSDHSLPDKSTLGEVVSERVANSMATLVAELGSEMLVAPTHDQFAMVPVNRAGGLETALQDDSVTVGPLKIPLGAVLTPLRAPLQNLFGARVVTGSVQQDSGGDFHLLVSTSTGQTWHLSTAEGSEGTTPSLVSAAEAAKRETSKMPAASAPVASMASARLLKRSDDLAYFIVTSDPAWSRAGMTSTPKAFEDFRAGLESWRRYEAMANYETLVGELDNAIKYFSAAVARDPRFAVAYYRLGLALRSDNQPAAAIRAFEAAIDVNPRYGEAENALASTLFDYDSFVQRPPATLAGDVADDGPSAERSRRKRARHIWEDLVAAPEQFPAATDRGSAYLGLCRTSVRASAIHDDEASDESEKLRILAKAYYFCTRADDIYAVSASSASKSIVATRAEIINEMAYTLLKAGEVTSSAPIALSMGCEEGMAILTKDDPNGVPGIRWQARPNRLQANATPLFEEARALLPDDPVIACNAATSALIQGNAHPMRDLIATAAARSDLARQFAERAARDNDQRSYREALAQYDQALQADPNDLDALNGYAYAFWSWRYLDPDSKPGVYEPLGEEAERYARRAVRLSAQGTSKTAQAIYQSTLGEVLMALGRPHEAISALEKAVAEVPPNSYFDEIRWDLARAYTCATEDDAKDPLLADEERCPNLLSKATDLYEEIRKREEEREGQIYTTLGRLDSRLVLNACAAAFPSALLALRYEAEQGDTMSVEVSTDYPDAEVHVWGNGVDARASKQTEWRASLGGARPIESHHRYFAQVVSAVDHANPLSAVFTFRTHKSAEQNLIRLAIDRPLPAPGLAREP